MKNIKGKVIITCAITGGVHTPSMSPYLPITAQQISGAAVGAVQAGASIVHLHARDPLNGRPSQETSLFREFVGTIRDQCDGIINITTGGAPTMGVDERLQPALQLKPELASLNMGSMNFGLFPMLGRYKDFKYDWEAKYLESTRDAVFRNSFKDIENILRSCTDNGTRFEFECYDTAHLYNLAHFLDRKLVTPPLFVQTVFGVLGGIGPHPDDVAHMKRTADRLFGNDFVWSVLGAGRAQMPTAAFAAANGGNVRVGLEDSLWDHPGELALENADQVRRVRKIIEGLALDVATPAEARELLALKGANQVGF